MVSRASTSELLPVQCPLSQEGTALGISRDGRKPRPLRPCNNRRNPIHLSTRTITAQRTSCSRTHPPRRRQYANVRNHCHSPYSYRVFFFYTATSVPHGQGDRHTWIARTGASAASMPSDFGDIPLQNSRSTRPAPRPCGGRMRGDARIVPTRCVFDRWEHSRRIFALWECSRGSSRRVFAFREYFRAWGGIAANGNRACGHFESLNDRIDKLNERMAVVVLAAKLPVACRKLGSDGEARKMRTGERF